MRYAEFIRFINPIILPKRMQKKQPIATGPTPAKKVELWWQKQDRLNREAQERIAALHRDIRDITGM